MTMKTILGPYQVIPFQNLSNTTVVTGTVTDTKRIDNISWAVCPIIPGVGVSNYSGTLTVQASLDYQPIGMGATIAVQDDVPGQGTWFTITGTNVTGTNPAPIFSYNQWAYPFMRVIFSGTGGGGANMSASVWVAGKALGS